MSLAALLTAVQDELISVQSWITAKNCGIRGGDGRPPHVWSGPKSAPYVAIVPTGNGPGTEFNDGLDETYSVDIVLTLRTGAIPDDRLMGEAFLKATTGLEPRYRSIMTTMLANRYTDGAAGGITKRAGIEFVEPLRWLGNDAQPQPVGPDWFSADITSQNAATFFGWRFSLHYGEARRPQAISGFT